jgi:hypothetical protein
MVFDLEGRVLMEETLVGNVKYVTAAFLLRFSPSSDSLSSRASIRFEGIEFL